MGQAVSKFKVVQKGTRLVARRSPKTLLKELDKIESSISRLDYVYAPESVGPLVQRMVSIQDQASLIPDGHALKSQVLKMLGDTFLQLFEKVLELQYLESGIASYRLAVLYHVDGDIEIPERLGCLAQSLTLRFGILGNLPDINQAIEYYSQAISLASGNFKSVLLQNLGATFVIRFERLGKSQDIDSAVESLTRAVSLAPNGGDLDLLVSLGGAHLHRFERLGSIHDLDSALEYLNRVPLLPNRRMEPSRLNNLGLCYMRRFENLGDLPDVDKAIEYLARGLSATPKGELMPGQFSNLAGCYTRRFERLGELNDVQQAIEYQTQAVSLTPDGDRYKPSWLVGLGISHQYRFWRLGELHDINRAIECHTKAVSLTPDGHGETSNWLNSLGIAHSVRFERLGEILDIDKAVECCTRAVSRVSDEHADKPSWLNSLGNAHSRRFNRLGEIHDIDKAIKYLAQAVQLTPVGRTDLAGRFNNLGNSYMSRFNWLGETNDIDEAINCHNQALSMSPEGHALKPSRLRGLGNSHKSRFNRLGDMDDINRAIEYQTQAVSLTPQGHADMPALLDSLGDSHRTRFIRLGEMHDIDKAIECQTQAASLIPEGHSFLPDILNGLGHAHKARFDRLAVGENTPHTNLNSLYGSGANRPDEQLEINHLGEQQDLEQAMEYFQASARCSAGHPHTRLVAARKWAQIAASYDISSSLPAYQHAMDIVPQLVWLGSTIDRRYTVIRSLGDLATEAASIAISAREYTLALEWLEQGRSIVWKQLLQLQTPLDELASTHSELARDLKEIGYALSNAGSQKRDLAAGHDSYSPGSILSESLEESARQHRRLAERYDQLITRVRQLPGFDSFLRPKSALELKTAAKDGPLVIINVHTTRCDALILQPNASDISHIPLPNLSQMKIFEAQTRLLNSLRQQGIRERGEHRKFVRKSKKDHATSDDDFKLILTDLWSDIVHPVLEFLGYTETLPVDELPHITWCTTGPLSFLPIHAAGRYDQSHPRIFDFAISSYTPTINALLPATSQEETPDFRVEYGPINCYIDAAGELKVNYNITLVPNAGEPSGILAVGQAATPGYSLLPNTVEELASVRKHVGELAYMQLDGSEATTTAVLNAMEKHSWIHIACHASQNTHDPTASGFRLHDGTLSLAMISRKLIKRKGLAFLSACQTAAGDEQLPDEAVHLAAGMLMIGYQSVVATMWSIMDADGPLVADEVYARLLKDGELDSTGAAKALHSAMGVLRAQVGEEAFVRWVPYVHIGA